MPRCPACHEEQNVKYGKASNDKQRYRCLSPNCPTKTFIADYAEDEQLGKLSGQIIDLAESGETVFDIAKALGVKREKVVTCVRSLFDDEMVVHRVLEDLTDEPQVSVAKLEDPVRDEDIWTKAKPDEGLLWHALDHDSGKVLAYVIDQHKNSAQERIVAILEPYGVENFVLEDELVED